MCDPEAEPLRMTFLLDSQDLLGLGRVDIDFSCRVAGLSEPRMFFQCEGDTGLYPKRSLEVDLQPGVAGTLLRLDKQVRLRAHARGGVDGTLFVALHDAEGELLLAYANADALPGAATDADDPDDRYPPSDFFAPLRLSETWPCPAACAPSGGLFVVDTCCRQRGAVEVGYGEETTLVYDRGRAELAGPGRLDVRVLGLGRESCEGSPGPATVTVFVWRVA